MALQPTKGMLTGGSSYPTKRLPGETDPFDPNAGTTTSSFGDIKDPGRIPEEDGRTPEGIEEARRLLDDFLVGEGMAEAAYSIWGEETFEEILDRVMAQNTPTTPMDLSLIHI